MNKLSSLVGGLAMLITSTLAVAQEQCSDLSKNCVRVEIQEIQSLYLCPELKITVRDEDDKNYQLGIDCPSKNVYLDKKLKTSLNPLFNGDLKRGVKFTIPKECLEGRCNRVRVYN